MGRLPGTLTTKQRRAIDALLTCPTVTAAAASIAVSKASIYRWLDSPAFVAALREAEAMAVDQASRNLAAAGGQAVARLVALIDGAAAEAVQLRAADAVLARLLQLRELSTLEARITALENPDDAGDELGYVVDIGRDDSRPGEYG